jgi:hypothetical protein
MLTTAGLYTFIYGTRIDDADPPPLLRFRSSNSFIIATVVIAVFTVSAMLETLYLVYVTYANYLGYLSVLVHCACSSIRVDGQGPCPRGGCPEMDFRIFEFVWRVTGCRI